MAKIRVQNTAAVPLNGRRPGEIFSLEVDADGTPLDFYWRRRFAEDAVARGYLKIVTADATPAEPVVTPSDPPPSPVRASPATPSKR